MKIIDNNQIDNNQMEVNSEEITDFLKKNIEIKGIYQKILFQKIINQKSQELNLIVTEEEIQGEAERQRRQKRLEKASDTYVWLANQMITSDDWEAGIKEKLLGHKLKAFLFAKDTKKVFADRKSDFDQVVLYQIIVPYEKLARELFYQIEEEELSFYLAAHLYDIDKKRRYQCGYEGKLYRWSLKPDFAARIFAANPKEVVFPFKTEQGYHIFMIEEFIPAELSPEIHEEILDKMFNEWLRSELNYIIYNSREKEEVTEPEKAKN